MTKWYYQKRKKKKPLLRPASMMTGRVRLTPTITKLILLDDPFGDDRFESRRYWFARWCYKNRDKHAPSGHTWLERFNQMEGVSLESYIKFSNENNLKEKFADRKKPKKFITTFVKK